MPVEDVEGHVERVVSQRTVQNVMLYITNPVPPNAELLRMEAYHVVVALILLHWLHR